MNSYLEMIKQCNFLIKYLMIISILFQGLLLEFIIKPLTIDWSHKFPTKITISFAFVKFLMEWAFCKPMDFVLLLFFFFFLFAIILGMVLKFLFFILILCVNFLYFFFDWNKFLIISGICIRTLKKKPGVARCWIYVEKKKKRIFNFNLDFKNKDN